ncbi:Antirepressor protein C-terminal domain-containing protein [Methylorubrum aminovorans]
MTESDMQPAGADRQPIVRVMEGELRADSRDVAAYFRKQHKHVLEAITNLHCSDSFRSANFRPIKINDLRGESTSHVEMTKDGFAFLVMGFTGAAAAVFKEAYIGQFNAMEAEIRRRSAVDPVALLNDPAALRGLLAGYSEKVLGLQGRIAEQAPKVEAYTRIAEADGSLCVRDAANSLQIRPIDLKRYLVANRWIYKRPGTKEWCGYSTRIITGLLTHKVATIPHDDGHDRIRTQVRITPKGLGRLAEEFALVAA